MRKRLLLSGTAALLYVVLSIVVVDVGAALVFHHLQGELFHWYDTRADLQLTFSGIIDEETGMRGYVATRDKLFLRPAQNLGVLNDDIARLAADTARTPLEPDVAKLWTLHALWLRGVVGPLVDRPGRPDALALQLRGKSLVDQMRATTARILAGIDVNVGQTVVIEKIVYFGATILTIALALIFGGLGVGFERKRVLQIVRLKALVEARNAALERSNESLQEFAYVASHDLQEPLRTVASFTQLLRRRYAGKLDKDADEFIEFAVDGASRMQRLIEDILEYSRVTTRSAEFGQVDLEAVAQATARTLRATDRARKPEISIAPLPTVWGDKVQLGQLLQNLMGNALKYNRSEHPRVEIFARQSGAHEWTISVRDNGIGIKPEYFEQVFHIFTRLHTRGEYTGTGIGLAICRRIVERHGGRITLESQEGLGSTFSFTLKNAPEAMP